MPEFSSLEEGLRHLESLHPKGMAGIELGLERVAKVKTALGQVQHCPVIIVGGTNGKGSTCAYLERIFAASGYRTGCYTSPHLLTYNERVRINGEPVSDEVLCTAFSRVEVARQRVNHDDNGSNHGNLPLTYFEFGTLAAWEVFSEAAVDVAILEVGLGGRLDAVNAYEPDVAIVTGVALDHMDWLGNDRESIGHEKAGIFRAGRSAICADPEPPQSLLDHATRLGADLQLIGRDFGYLGDKTQWLWWGRGGLRRGGLAPPAIRGRQQLANASAALAAIEVLKPVLPVDMQSIRQGLMTVDLPGRFQLLPGQPTVILDVAHNPQAVAALASNLDEVGFHARTHAVLGMLADKDIAGTLAVLRGKVDYWHLATLDVPRGATASTLAGLVAAHNLGGEVVLHPDPALAFAAARKTAGEGDRILAFGSFYTVAAVIRALKEYA